MLESLRWLNVPEDTAQAILASSTPETVQSTHAVLRRELGSVGVPAPLPDHPDAPYFYVHAFLAVLPDTRKWHADRGIPEEISRATLSDLAGKLAEEDGKALTMQTWLSRHFRGSLYRLGRLQFDRTVVDGEPVLEVHIPGDGPLEPDACDESFAQAADFFSRHFPEERYRRAVCHSWLFDEQLNDYLSPDTNILKFQRRFTIDGGSDSADEDIVNSIFGYHVDRSDLPQRTSLQRAIGTHLAEGNHWHHRTGRLTLPG